MNANHNKTSTKILNDSIKTNHWRGTDCKNRVPLLEKAKSNTNGNGRSIARAGRGGSLLKSAKKPLVESTASTIIHNAMTIEVIPTILRLLPGRSVFFNTAFKPAMTRAIQTRVSNSIKMLFAEK